MNALICNMNLNAQNYSETQLLLSNAETDHKMSLMCIYVAEKFISKMHFIINAQLVSNLFGMHCTEAEAGACSWAWKYLRMGQICVNFDFDSHRQGD